MEWVLVLRCGGSGKPVFARRLGVLIAAPRRILDGDLGPYDVLEVRLAADTAVVLNPSPARCAWRALRRGRERWDFGRWLLIYRWRHLAELRRALPASDVDVVELRSPRAVAASSAALTEAVNQCFTS